MKSRLLLAFLVFAFFMPAKSAYAQYRYYLPHFVDGHFPLAYKTSFILFNNSDVSVTATLQLTDNSGAPLTATIAELGVGSHFTIPLGPGATRIYQTDGTAEGLGAATVTATRPIGVSAVFTVYDSAGNFVSESGVGASDLMTDFVLPVDSTTSSLGSALTGLALFNPGTSDASLTLTLFGTDGTTPAGGTMSVSLKSGNHMAAFVALNFQGQFFPTLTSFRGTMRVQSSTPISALVLRQFQTSTTTCFTSLPVVSRSSTRSTLNLAHIANGASGIGFKTSFLIFNISQSTANVTLSLTKDDGTPFSLTIQGSGTSNTFNFSLAPNASVFLQTDGLGSIATGAATITSNVPLGASSIFTVLNSQGQFQTEAGVGDSPALTSLTLPVDITGLSDTGVAFFNPGTSSVTVTLKLLDANDAVVGTTTRNLAAKAHLAGFVDQFFTVSSFRGSLAVGSTGGIASTVLRQVNFGANYTTLPTAPGVTTGKAAAVPLLPKTLTGVTPSSGNNVVLSPGFLLTGTVSGSGNASQIIANAGGSNIYAGAVDPSTGKYVIVVPPGTYQLTAFYQPAGANSTVTVTSGNLATVQVNGNTTQDITLPPVSLFTVSGNVAGLSALPPGASTMIVFTAVDYTMQGMFTLGGSGDFQGALPAGSYVASITRAAVQFSQPSQGESPLSIYNLGSLAVSGSGATATYTIPSTASLTGTIGGLGPTSSGGTSVIARDTSEQAATQSVCCFFSATSTATPGLLTNAYQMVLVRNRSYSVGVSVELLQGTSPLGLVSFPLNATPVALGSDTFLNFTLPNVPSTATISGRVTDTSGNGVADVVISASSQSITGASNLAFTAVATSDASGNYSFELLNGTNYTLLFSPPPPKL